MGVRERERESRGWERESREGERVLERERDKRWCKREWEREREGGWECVTNLESRGWECVRKRDRVGDGRECESVRESRWWHRELVRVSMKERE